MAQRSHRLFSLAALPLADSPNTSPKVLVVACLHTPTEVQEAIAQAYVQYTMNPSSVLTARVVSVQYLAYKPFWGLAVVPRILQSNGKCYQIEHSMKCFY